MLFKPNTVGFFILAAKKANLTMPKENSLKMFKKFFDNAMRVLEVID